MAEAKRKAEDCCRQREGACLSLWRSGLQRAKIRFCKNALASPASFVLLCSPVSTPLLCSPWRKRREQISLSGMRRDGAWATVPEGTGATETCSCAPSARAPGTKLHVPQVPPAHEKPWSVYNAPCKILYNAPSQWVNRAARNPAWGLASHVALTLLGVELLGVRTGARLGHQAGTGGSGGAAAVAEGSLEPPPPCQVPSPPPGVAGEAATGGSEGCEWMT